MPWTIDNPPRVAENWTDEEKRKCVSAANAVLERGGSEEEAIFACIHAAGKAEEEKAMDEIEIKAEESERERLHREQEQRAKRYGIQPKDGGHLTPPAGYPTDPDQYGDPVNYRYPIDEEHIRAAIAYFNQREHQRQGGYSSEEWAIIGKRIAAAASRLLDAEYEYRDGRVVRSEKSLAVKVVEKDGDTLKVAGWGVVFYGHDLEGDTFTPETDFWLDRPPGPRPVLYEHSLNVPGLEVLGMATIKATADGLWVEAELDRHNKYVQMLQPLIERGVLGWSSGAAAHLVRRDGDTVLSWPIVEVSLTPTPAEPRTLGVRALRSIVDAQPALKSLLPEDGGVAPSADGESAESSTSPNPNTKEVTMSEIDYDALAQRVADMVAGRVLKSIQPENVPGVVKPEPQGETKSFRDFLLAVARNDQKRLAEAYAAKAALSGAAGTTGGYLIPEQFVPEILGLAAEQSIVLPRARRFPTHGPLRQPIIDLSGGASGVPAWFGGMRMYWHEEAAALTESEPAFEQYQLNDHGIGAYAFVSNRLLSASGVDVDGWLRRLMGEALAWYLDYYFLRGDGVGKPLGILNSPALVTYTRATANTFTAADALNMVARLFPSSVGKAVWLMNPTVLPQLGGMVIGDSPVWQPNFREGTAGTLLGMPIVFTEKLPVLGQTGDVLLADFSYYGVLLPNEMEIAVSEHYRFVNDQLTFRINAWVDGQPMVKSPATLADGSTQVSPFVALGLK